MGHHDLVAHPLSQDELQLIDAYWRAANYLSVGQIYLLDNPLLQRPLRLEDIKPRLLGHWGTTPGLNLIYAHANRVIKQRDLDAIYIIDPGHGGPGLVANAYLEGTYTEVYSDITRDVDGLRKLYRQVLVPRTPTSARPLQTRRRSWSMPARTSRSPGKCGGSSPRTGARSFGHAARSRRVSSSGRWLGATR
jgi:XFP N-terminal domain